MDKDKDRQHQNTGEIGGTPMAGSKVTHEERGELQSKEEEVGNSEQETQNHDKNSVRAEQCPDAESSSNKIDGIKSAKTL